MQCSGAMMLLVLYALLIISAASLQEWESGNTKSIPHPSEATTSTTIPSTLSRVADALQAMPMLPHRGAVDVRNLFLGPVAHYPWLVRNETHRWALLDVAAAAISRLYFAMMSHSTATDPGAIRLVSRNSWALCFAKEPMESGSGIEHGQRCSAFRSRQGPIALGVATVHDVVLQQSIEECSDLPLGDHHFGRCGRHIHMTIMEETMQIFHPDEVRDRADFIAHLTDELLQELVADKVTTTTVSWSAEKALEQLPQYLAHKSAHRALRGMSLLALEVFRSPPLERTASQREPTHTPQSLSCGALTHMESSCENEVPPNAAAGGAPARNHLRIGVVSQNVWNFNGDWDNRRRALSLDIASTVPFEVDVLMLQEVRYHSDAPDLPLLHPSVEGDSAPTQLPPNGKLQALDIALGLPHSVSCKNCTVNATIVSADVQSFAFYPSMSYLHLPAYQAPRIEMEGLMNVVMGGPRRSEKRLVGHVRHLLKRSTTGGDGGDDHQRAVLCSIVVFDAPDSHEVRVDFCTSHFALGEDAQNSNALEAIRMTDILRHRTSFPEFQMPEGVKQSRDVPRASATVFTGDLNSEPHHHVAELFQANAFVDMWETCPPQHRRCHRNVVHDAPDEELVSSDGCGNTFNTNDAELVKRIDFIYLKVHQTDVGGIADGQCLSFATLGTTLSASGRVSSDHLGVAAMIEFRLL
jgi:hypothetical protein